MSKQEEDNGVALKQMQKRLDAMSDTVRNIIASNGNTKNDIADLLNRVQQLEAEVKELRELHYSQKNMHGVNVPAPRK